MVEDAAVRAAHRARLYAVMWRLTLVAEATRQGSVARAMGDAQRDLWPVIAHFGGSPQDFGAWQLDRENEHHEWGQG